MSKKRAPLDGFLAGPAAVDYKDSGALGPFLLELLRHSGRPLPMDAILRISRLPRKAKKYIEGVLYGLQDEGRVIRASGGWAAPKKLAHVTGVLSVQRAGMGFVTPERGQDVYIHPAAMNDAWHGDTVEVLLLPGKRGPSREGRIVRVLQRAHAELPAHAVRQERDGGWVCTPANQRIPALFVANTALLPGPVKEGDLLLIRPGDKLSPNLWQAEATLNLEHEDSPAAQERLTKSEHAIPGPFPAAALAEAERLPEDPVEEDFTGRRDLRGLDFVTIDGRTARDFDDAIHVEDEQQGFCLRVAIADVAHYVPAGSALDAEARLRGNSYYFPLSVEPMLPERLSNGLCSLRPHVPRLVMVAEMHFSSSARIQRSAFYPAVIESKARLTYGQIEQGLLLGAQDAREALAPVLPMLERAERLARLLQQMREERGSLDFDVPEPQFLFDEQGHLTGVTVRKRHFGHRLIEECMIAANEAVADFLEKERRPTLYRVHQPPDPDKLSSVVRYLEQSGLATLLPPGKGKNGKARSASAKQGALPSPKDLQRILRASRDSGQDYVLTNLLLRAMMQARYQSENQGHYGLSSRAYCHFTSPIRRYADLVVHRTLKQALGLCVPEGGRPLSEARLERIADHINETERAAVAAEREIHKRLAVVYLRDKVGEEFEGIISGLTEFGFFVELPEVMAEGMVRFAVLENDFFEYVPDRREARGVRTGRRYTLGQRLRVAVSDVNLGRLEINLTIAGDEAATGQGRAPVKKRAGARNGAAKHGGKSGGRRK